MKWSPAIIMMALIVAVTAAPASALFGEFPNDKPFKSDGYHPASVIDAINGSERVYGWGTDDMGVLFYFKGDTDKLNQFLATLAKTGDARLHVSFTSEEGKGETHWLRAEKTTAFGYNWNLLVHDRKGEFWEQPDGTMKEASPRWIVDVGISLHGPIDLAKLKLPAIYTASVGGRLGNFVEAHSRSRADAIEKKLKWSDVEPTTEELTQTRFADILTDDDIVGDAPKVGEVPAALREAWKLSPFYKKHLDYHGFPIISSEKVSDAALIEARYLIDQMLSQRRDIVEALVKNKIRFVVMAPTEMTTDVPEHSDLKPKAYWDKRARGLGATRQRPAVSCGEENLLNLKGDRYATENILIHEFAHALQQMGLNSLDDKFEAALKDIYDAAMKQELWKGKYAANNLWEYWAEGVQSYFDTNRENDHDHNHVNTREELKAYDPRLFKLIDDVFKQSKFRYVRYDKRQAAGPG